MRQTLMQRLRVDQHITRRKLAEISGVKERTIRELESGRIANPRDETVFALAKALDVPTSQLVDDFAGHETTEATV